MDIAQSCLDRGVVRLSTMPFLFLPGDVLIWKEKDEWNASVSRGSAVQTSPSVLYWDPSRTNWAIQDGKNTMDNDAKGKEFSTTWSFESWQFRNNGGFIRKKSKQQILFKADSLDGEINITKLNVFPLRFADNKVKLRLEERGKRF